jgi:predicted transposase/invertase (TIGR01784 family)
MIGCEHAQHTFWLKDDTWTGEHLTLDWLSVGFLELRKSIFADGRAQLWAQFLLSGLAPDGAPDYLVEAERIVEYWKLSRKERIMMSVMERERVREANEKYTAHREGLEKGKAAGRFETQYEVATRALARGIPVEDIADITGLTIEELNSLR